MVEEDLITIDLLVHCGLYSCRYQSIPDDEIELARKFANELANSEYRYKYYSDDFYYFVNQLKFTILSNNDYDSLKTEIYQRISVINELSDNKYWDFEIYYEMHHNDYLFIKRADRKDDLVTLKYDIKKKDIYKCEIMLPEFSIMLGEIHKDCLKEQDMDIKEEVKI